MSEVQVKVLSYSKFENEAQSLYYQKFNCCPLCGTEVRHDAFRPDDVNVIVTYLCDRCEVQTARMCYTLH